MIVLDSSIAHALINGRIAREDTFGQSIYFSEATRVAVLGEPGLSVERLRLLEALFAASIVVPLSSEVTQRAIALRQMTQIGLHDAFVAATADLYRATLWTDRHNVFTLCGVSLYNPFDKTDQLLAGLLGGEKR
jgi:toxin FitB